MSVGGNEAALQEPWGHTQIAQHHRALQSRHLSGPFRPGLWNPEGTPSLVPALP